MCDHKKNTCTQELSRASGCIQACCTQAGPAHVAGRRDGIDR